MHSGKIIFFILVEGKILLPVFIFALIFNLSFMEGKIIWRDYVLDDNKHHWHKTNYRKMMSLMGRDFCVFAWFYLAKVEEYLWEIYKVSKYLSFHRKKDAYHRLFS